MGKKDIFNELDLMVVSTTKLENIRIPNNRFKMSPGITIYLFILLFLLWVLKTEKLYAKIKAAQTPNSMIEKSSLTNRDVWEFK